MSAPLPASQTDIRVNAAALALALGAFALCYHTGWLAEPFWRTVALLGVLATPILLHDLLIRRVDREACAELSAARPINLSRIALKTLGLYAIFGLFALAYATFPEYAGRFYDPYFRLMRPLLPCMALLAPLYFAYLDRRMDVPEDAYFFLGRALTFRPIAGSLIPILLALRGWLVKAFFLPLMFAYALDNVATLSRHDVWRADSVIAWYYVMNAGLYLVDVLFATLGYILTLRIAGAHIRSTEPTMLGWVAALICYAPFWTALFSSQYFSYETGYGFTYWLRPYPLILPLWAGGILFLTSIYAWATLAMGIRFSNLTYRGLISSGPYRFSKHPAYLAKNLSWWMVTLPFLTQGSPWDAARACLMLLGVNALYYLRAHTEERHLSRYPEYVAYATAMNTRGLSGILATAFPALRYRPPGR